jgi:hypothetical protein
METSLLHEELTRWLEGWEANQHATEAQRRCWPQDRGLGQEALGCDHENCLRLLMEDGFDGEPVGSVPARSVRGYFQSDGGHPWLPDRDLVRFGAFFHLGFFRILALVLKGQWERSFSSDLSWSRRGCTSEGALETSVRFKPGLNGSADKTELYRLFEENGRLASSEGYDGEQFGTLIDQMILSDCHLFGTCSPELDDFIARQKEEQKEAAGAALNLSEEFWIKKCVWIELQNEAGDKLLELENYRLKAANVNSKWLKTFGHVYLPLMEVKFACHALQRRIQLKQAGGPGLTLEQIERMEKETCKKETKRLEALKTALAEALVHGMYERDRRAVGGEELTAFERECKKVLREIYKHSHPDGIGDHGFSENQKARLREYFDRAIRIRTTELGGDFRQLHVLCDILASVKALWGSMGVEIREDAAIQGSTLKEKLQWLDNRIEVLEEEIRDIKAEIFAYANDVNVKEKLACFASKEQIAETLKQMELKKNEYERQAAELEAQFLALFQAKEPCT